MRTFLPLFLTVFLCAGCVRQTPEWAPPVSPVKAGAQAVLADLAENAAALSSFEAHRVKVSLRSPGLEASQQLTGSDLYYQKPGKLHLVGRKLSKTYARMTIAEKEFLLELPVDHAFYYRASGQAFGADAPEVAPGALVEELFAPEEWASIPPEEVEFLLTGSDPGATTATLRFPPEDSGVERTVTATRLGEQWVLAGGTLSQGATLLVEASYKNYELIGGVFFPHELEIRFPQENAFMRFSLGSVTLNTPVDTAAFDVTTQVESLRRQGYTEREPYGY